MAASVTRLADMNPRRTPPTSGILSGWRGLMVDLLSRLFRFGTPALVILRDESGRVVDRSRAGHSGVVVVRYERTRRSQESAHHSAPHATGKS
jgi:hypothetical protein